MAILQTTNNQVSAAAMVVYTMVYMAPFQNVLALLAFTV